MNETRPENSAASGEEAPQVWSHSVTEVNVALRSRNAIEAAVLAKIEAEFSFRQLPEMESRKLPQKPVAGENNTVGQLVVDSLRFVRRSDAGEVVAQFVITPNSLTYVDSGIHSVSESVAECLSCMSDLLVGPGETMQFEHLSFRRSDRFAGSSSSGYKSSDVLLQGNPYTSPKATASDLFWLSGTTWFGNDNKEDESRIFSLSLEGEMAESVPRIDCIFRTVEYFGSPGLSGSPLAKCLPARMEGLRHAQMRVIERLYTEEAASLMAGKD